MLYRRVCYLIFAVLLLSATACQPIPLPAITPEEPTPAIAPQPAVTATAQPTATAAPAPTAAPTATVPVQPTAVAPLKPTPTQTPHGTPLLPESCRPASGNRVYIRAEDAFCFSFPERFKIEASSPGAARIVGPALEKNADPIRVTLEVTTKAVPAGSTLDGSVDEALAEFADFKAWEIKRTPAKVDGKPAVVVEPVPGRLSGRALYFMHGNTFYKLYFWPVGVKLAQADLAELYETVTGSFRFLPAPATPAAEGVPVAAGPLSIVLPAGLATSASGSQVPPAEGETVAPWDVTPGHTLLTLEGYPLHGKTHEPQIYVFPAQAYAEMRPAAFESIQRLDNILYGPGGVSLSADRLPTVPFLNAQQAFSAHVQALTFQNGGGVRFLTEYAQYPVSANNQDLFYHFEGVTRDGAYYVIAILPITAPALAETSDSRAAVPAGGVAYPDLSDPKADMPGYYAAITALLNSTPTTAFIPALGQLDALMQSIRVAP